MAQLIQCSQCRGLVPAARVTCPHCEAAVSRLASGRGLQTALTAVGGGLAMITAAACYGIAGRYNPNYDPNCYRFSDGGVGTRSGTPYCTPCKTPADAGGVVSVLVCVNGAYEPNHFDADAGDADAGDVDAGDTDAGE